MQWIPKLHIPPRTLLHSRIMGQTAHQASHIQTPHATPNSRYLELSSLLHIQLTRLLYLIESNHYQNQLASRTLEIFLDYCTCLTGIYSSNELTWSIYSVLSSVFSARDTSINQRHKTHVIMECIV